jgi:hypothetical protein
MDNGPANHNSASTAAPNFSVNNPSIGIANDRDIDRWRFSGESPQPAAIDDFNFNSNMSMGMNNVGSNFTWEMIGLGLEEPLPPQETIDELYVPRFLWYRIVAHCDPLQPSDFLREDPSIRSHDSQIQIPGGYEPVSDILHGRQPARNAAPAGFESLVRLQVY